MHGPAPSSSSPRHSEAQVTTLPVLIALGVAHLLNDMMQSLIAAIYPLIKAAYQLDYGQIGIITLTFQLTASIFQPLVGMYTDKRPRPFAMVAAMGFTLCGLLVLAQASSYAMLLIGAALVGTGSAVFHPEATRGVRLAAGDRPGFAQGIFQVGGQIGGAIGPLLAAYVVVPQGQKSLAWFSLTALLTMGVLAYVSFWLRPRIVKPKSDGGTASATTALAGPPQGSRLGRAETALAITVLVVLLFSKNAYSSSFSNYYTFFTIERFGVSVQMSQVLLFLFLVASAMGAVFGGHLGDRIGRRKLLWFSILGALPFTLALPYANLPTTIALTIVVNLIMASSFASILIYAMELLPGRVGFIGGLFYGLSFGLGGLAAALLGELADATSITTVYHVCSFLPAIGLFTVFLPDLDRRPR